MSGIADWASAAAPGDVTQPPDGLIVAGYQYQDIPAHNHFNWIIQQIALIASRKPIVFEGVGPLGGMVGLDLDQHPIVDDRTISTIVILCPYSPASGTIEVELFTVTPGGSPATLYTSAPLPTLTCNGGYAMAILTAPDLPDIVDLTAGDMLIARLTAAPSDATDVKVMVQ